MNHVVEEMKAILEGDEDALMHYGTKRHSGRYPWGSGENGYQHGSRDFLGRIEQLKKQGWTETAENIKKEFGEDVSLSEYRMEKAWCQYERKLDEIRTIKSMLGDGKTPTEIGKALGKNESTIRSIIETDKKGKIHEAMNTVEFLKGRLDELEGQNGIGMLDAGVGSELFLNVSTEKLNQALYYLEGEGYSVYGAGVAQNNPGQQTIQRILCKPGVEYKQVYEQMDKIGSLEEYTSHDGGKTFEKFQYPTSIDGKRVKVMLADDIGVDGRPAKEKDGLVEIRRGVEDLSLGNAHYSQVRILVDNDKYIKGMAVYSDDMPDGVDIVFNTSKTDMSKALKPIKDDPENPFGSLIGPQGQSYYVDKDGNRKLSAINKRADEGDWSDWKDALPSQFLSKQPEQLIRKQLNIAKSDKLAEYDDICAIENPTIKKHLLNKFADECDAAAVDLKAAALPRQKYHVMIPVNSLKDNEVYAPDYDNGEQIALIRYPHGGTFEIPILTVNNKHAPAKKLIGTESIDVVAINSKNAARLSGADFDGDTVMCIPTGNGKVNIRNRKELEGLKDFEPHEQYKETPGMKYMKYKKKDGSTSDNTQKEMGVISNLITDMTLLGASDDELARAVRHSMVVIDAAKHKLNYKQSEKDNNIAELKQKYQIHVKDDGTLKYGGAATLISRSKGEYTVDKRQGSSKTNVKGTKDYDPTRPEGAKMYKTADDLYYPERKMDKKAGTMTIRTADGKKITYSLSDKDAVARYNPKKHVNKDTGEVTFTDSTGTIVYKKNKRTQPSTNMAETDDAYTLVSEARHPKEILYADYANSMKALANRARLEEVKTPNLKFDANAKKVYQKEVASLNEKLKTALLNAPKERAVYRQANAELKRKQDADPSMSKGDIKKERQKSVSKYRAELGSISRKERSIKVTDREWEAIQAGAISDSTLRKILNNADVDDLRSRATPRTSRVITSAKMNRIKSLNNNGYTIGEIAKKLGLPASTISDALKGGN